MQRAPLCLFNRYVICQCLVFEIKGCKKLHFSDVEALVPHFFVGDED